MEKRSESSAFKRYHSEPEGHWNWPIHVTHKHGIRFGDMIFVGGQADLDAEGRVRHPGDLKIQSRNAIDNILKVLVEFGADLADVVKIVAYYLNDGSVDETAFLIDVGAVFGTGQGPVITAVPVSYLAYPVMVVQMEAIAMLSVDGRCLPRETGGPSGHLPLPSPFAQGLRCGEMIYVSGQVACDAAGAVFHPGDMLKQSEVVMENLEGVLKHFGATLDDAVKFNIYHNGLGAGDNWERVAKVRAHYFTEPGPVATGIQVAPFQPAGLMVKMEVIAMLGVDGRHLPRRHVWPEGHWDWSIHLPYKHGLQCRNLIFIGGQVSLDPHNEVVDPDDMVAQTHTSMKKIDKVLAGFGAKMDDVVKVTAFYKGKALSEDLHTNLKIRSGFFSNPGPASTEVTVPILSHQTMMIEVEVIAMTE